jgi:hypothetical protein
MCGGPPANAVRPGDPTLPVFRLMWPNPVLRFALFLTGPRDALLPAAAQITSALERNLLSPLRRRGPSSLLLFRGARD